jgi:arabinogalactan oligomer/maltooligosaccharide transport system substrate-binding protein
MSTKIRVKKRTLLKAGAAAALTALALTACGGGNSSGSDKKDTKAGSSTAAKAGSGSLTVWVDSERLSALKPVVKDYETSTGVKVKLVSKSTDKAKDDFIQQASSASGPDVVMGAHDWVGELVKNGIAAPLEVGDKASDFSDVAIKASTYQGKVYMLPYAVENLALLRNTALVKEAPKSFDDMIAAGKKAGAETPFVVQQGKEGDPYHLYPFQTAFGAPVFGTDAKGDYDATKLELNKGDDFATWLGKQGKAGTISTEVTGDIASDKFTKGKAAFWLTGPWNVKVAEDAGIKLAVDQIPSPTSSAAVPFAGVKGFFLNEHSKNKLSATDFLVNYMGKQETQTRLFKSSAVLPALKASADEAASDPVIAGFQKAGEKAVPMPAIPEMGTVFESWGVSEAAIINGKDPKATWSSLVDKVTKAIAKK